VVSAHNPYRRFTHQETVGDAIDAMTIQGKIDCEDGYCLIWIPMTMLALEFMTVVPSWHILPLPCTAEITKH
jgi:hypothetical protein